MRSFLIGDEGPEVHDVQQRLMALGYRIDPAELEGRFGEATSRAVRAFQEQRRLRVDGIVGPDTWGQLVEAGYRLGDRVLYLRMPLFRGDDVRDLQRMLNALGFDAGREDGLFGPTTDRAIREFQDNTGDAADGIAGPSTVRALQRMRPYETGPGRAMVREREELRSLRASIEGLVVAVDRGPREDPEPEGSLVARVVDELSAIGAKAVATGPDDGPADPSSSAAAANDAGASLCVSFLDGSDAAEAGPVCSYFGSARTHSPSGMLLARMIVEELEPAVGRPGRIRPLAGTLLRETRMPAVQIEIAAEPSDAGFVERVGSAVARGIRRFCAQ